MLGNFSLNVKSDHILHALSYCYLPEYVNFVMNESSEELPRIIPMEKILEIGLLFEILRNIYSNVLMKIEIVQFFPPFIF